MKKLISLLVGMASSTAAFADGEPLVELFRDGTSVRTYESFQDALLAVKAGEGDKVLFLRDWTPDRFYGLDAPITLDLGGHTVIPEANVNEFCIWTPKAVVQNGTVGSNGQSAFYVGANNKLYLTNVTVAVGIGAFGLAGSEVHYGPGCVVVSGMVACGADGSGVAAFVESSDFICASDKLVENNGSGTATLSICGGRFKTWPDWSYFAEGTGYVEGVPYEHPVYGTLNNWLLPMDEAGTKGYVAMAKRRYYTNFTEAYWGVQYDEGETIHFCADVEFDGLASSSQTLTFDLHGHTIRGKGSNFVSAWDGKKLTLRGGGTIVDEVGGACLYAGAQYCAFDVFDCTVSGKLAAYGEADTVINFLSDGLTVDTEAFVCGSGGLTVNVSNGVIRSTAMWDSGDGESGTMINAAGGEWVLDPVALSAKPKFAIADGKIVRRDAPGGLYKVVDGSEQKLSADLAGDAPVTVYTGTAPQGRMTLNVALSASGAWDGEKKALADFSGLSGFDPTKVDLVIESCPKAYAGRLDVKFRSGVLSAGIKTGLILLFR
ncbi:MAG: hypothetical protein II863_18880 [Kiritimatiellae bacterium]|nr:hypothetical protein [Kiritimatiellia bacterium]